MALESACIPRLDRPLSAALFDWARTTPDVAAIFLPQDEHVPRKTWRQLADDVLRMIAHLDRLGVCPGDRVVLWSDNRYEWIVVDLAIQSMGAIHVPLHGSLPAPAAAAQIEHAEPRLVIVANAAMADGLRGQSAARSAEFLTIEQIDAAESQPGLLDRIATLSIDDGTRLVERHAISFDPHAIATILYSSGTSGEPKAVALTHANLISNAYAVIELLGETPRERRLNFLPFSHIYARTCDFYTWLAGGSQLVLARSRETIFADCRQTQPTLINGVPFFYQRLAQKIADSEAAGAPMTIQEMLGGNINACMCGGAALPVDTFDFFHARGVALLPGYGLTESSPVIAVATLPDLRRGTVGKPIPGIEVCIADDGELLTRGPHVMKEYWKDPELTRETIRDGWLHTGDLGAVDADGFVSITGRKKEMIVLSTGKKAVPTHIEGLLCREPLILQAMVIGDDQCYLSALVTTNPDLLSAWLAAEGLPDLSRAEAVTHAIVAEMYEERIRRQLGALPAYERVKRFVLLDHAFTIEEGLLTPKLSLRRDAIRRKFQKEIASLYAGGGVAVEYDDARAPMDASTTENQPCDRP
ncbi:MAG: long-chain fatty acid--CoA ligase [Pirellulales bacterium]|nr:long-chain fatty acid--CoA ligase [Pirellulales bacterium]